MPIKQPRLFFQTLIFLCSLSNNHTAVARLFGNFEKKYQSAFVLPTYQFGNTRYIILGQESGGAHKGCWSFFGGSKKPHEKSLIATAIREFSEEALTSTSIPWINNKTNFNPFGAQPNYERNFSLDSRIDTILINNQKKSGLFILRMSADEANMLLEQFPNARKKMQRLKKHAYTEMHRVGYVNYADLKRAVLLDQTSVYGYQISEDRHGHIKKERVRMHLRPVVSALLKPYLLGQQTGHGSHQDILIF